MVVLVNPGDRTAQLARRVQRSDLVAQAIHLLMESARLGLAQNNPGAVVGAVAQLDKLCGLSIARR